MQLASARASVYIQQVVPSLTSSLDPEIGMAGAVVRKPTPRTRCTPAKPHNENVVNARIMMLLLNYRGSRIVAARQGRCWVM